MNLKQLLSSECSFTLTKQASKWQMVVGKRKLKHHFNGDNDLFETDSSDSEAEEVNVHYGEEELSQSFGLETCSDPSVSSISESCDREKPND